MVIGDSQTSSYYTTGSLLPAFAKRQLRRGRRKKRKGKKNGREQANMAAHSLRFTLELLVFLLSLSSLNEIALLFAWVVQ